MAVALRMSTLYAPTLKEDPSDADSCATGSS